MTIDNYTTKIINNESVIIYKDTYITQVPKGYDHIIIKGELKNKELTHVFDHYKNKNQVKSIQIHNTPYLTSLDNAFEAITAQVIDLKEINPKHIKTANQAFKSSHIEKIIYPDKPFDSLTTANYIFESAYLNNDPEIIQTAKNIESLDGAFKDAYNTHKMLYFNLNLMRYYKKLRKINHLFLGSNAFEHITVTFSENETEYHNIFFATFTNTLCLENIEKLKEQICLRLSDIDVLAINTVTTHQIEKKLNLRASYIIDFEINTQYYQNNNLTALFNQGAAITEYTLEIKKDISTDGIKSIINDLNNHLEIRIENKKIQKKVDILQKL